MKRRTIGVLIALVSITLPSAMAEAQEAWLELLRADLRADKVAVLTVGMGLSDEQGRVFWPIYREFDTELSAIHDRRMELIKRYAATYRSMDDAQSGEIAGDWFGIQDGLLKLKKKYYRKVEKALDSTIAARFIQVERQIELVIDVQIAAELPLIRAMEAVGGSR